MTRWISVKSLYKTKRLLFMTIHYYITTTTHFLLLPVITFAETRLAKSLGIS